MTTAQTSQDRMPADTLASLAEQAYRRDFDAAQINLGDYGRPGEGFGRQVFYGSQYLGRIDRGQFITDSTNWKAR